MFGTFEPVLNMQAAWVGIWLGFVSGMLLGLGFHREEFLGGYASHKRRLYRLGHISFFGLALMNALFYLTALTISPSPGTLWSVASWLFVAGAVTMPLCCVLMAHQPKAHLVFGVPVGSLLVASTLTLKEVLGL